MTFIQVLSLPKARESRDRRRDAMHVGSFTTGQYAPAVPQVHHILRFFERFSLVPQASETWIILEQHLLNVGPFVLGALSQKVTRPTPAITTVHTSLCAIDAELLQKLSVFYESCVGMEETRQLLDPSTKSRTTMDVNAQLDIAMWSCQEVVDAIEDISQYTNYSATDDTLHMQKRVWEITKSSGIHY